MNNRELKQELKQTYLPPASQTREAFLKNLEESACGEITSRKNSFGQTVFAGTVGKRVFGESFLTLSLKDFLQIQLRYISSYIWVVNGIFFLLAIWMLQAVDGYHAGEKCGVIAGLSVLTPFLAITSLMELNRSARYRMDELEMSTRFSLRAVLLARMGVLGCCNLLVFMAVVPFAVGMWDLTWMEMGLCLFGPYCLTAILILWIIRHFGRGVNLHICLAAAAGLCFWGTISVRLSSLASWMLEIRHPAVVLLCLLVLTGYECRRYLSQCSQEMVKSVCSQ